MNRLLNSIVLVVVLLLLVTPSLFAQPSQPAPAPFGSVELLIAAGAAYGGKKTFDRLKKESDK